MIQLKDINKTYNNGAPLHVLKGIDLDIKRGEFVSIMGASGSGKSTLLNILGILDNYDTGEYYLNGTLIKNLSETKAAEYRNRMIGFIFQSFNLISFKNLHNFHRSLAIKSTGRFIGQDNLRLSDKGTGDGNTLFLSTGHFIRHVVRPILQSQAIQIFQCHGVALPL